MAYNLPNPLCGLKRWIIPAQPNRAGGEQEQHIIIKSYSYACWPCRRQKYRDTKLTPILRPIKGHVKQSAKYPKLRMNYS